MEKNDLVVDATKDMKTVADWLSGAKILVPFILVVFSLAAVWYSNVNSINMLQKDITNLTTRVAESEASIESLKITTENQRVTLTEVTTDLKYIKDAQKETLELVRKLTNH